MKTGIDIVEISRISRLISETDFINKYFSIEEQVLFSSKQNPANTVAGNFAAKEAFSKALGTGIRNFKLNEISVLRDSLGKPYFEFSENIKNILYAKGVLEIDISISHEKEYAVAMVIFDTDTKLNAYKTAIEKEEHVENAITSKLIQGFLRKRATNSHKGDYGKVLAVCGSPAYMGAGIMSTTSVLKCGSGLVTLACGKSLNGAYRMGASEVMTLPLDDTDGIIDTKYIPDIILQAKNSDAVLVGCGLTNCENTFQIVKALIESEIKSPIILDADGINVLSGNADILKKAKMPIILTPHLVEFSRISGLDAEYIINNRKDAAKSFAEEYGVFLVLKSDKTIVATSDGKIYENILGNPGMAKGGSGDVLAGCITSFVGQNTVSSKKENNDTFDAILQGVLTGVYIHSLSGDMACFDKGEDGMLVSDIIENIPYTLKYLKQNI